MCHWVETIKNHHQMPALKKLSIWLVGMSSKIILTYTHARKIGDYEKVHFASWEDSLITLEWVSISLRFSEVLYIISFISIMC